MTKRKQPEAVVGELNLEKGADKVGFQYGEEALSRTEAVAESLPTTSEKKELPSCGKASGPTPSAPVKTVGDWDWSEETIWTLMEADGYMVW